MKNIIKVFCISLVVLSAKLVYGTGNDDQTIQEEVLKPRILRSSLSPIKYEIQLEYLMPYLESVVIIEVPALQNKKSKASIKKPYITDGKLIVESEYWQKGNLVQGLKNLLTNKKKRQVVEHDSRYVVGLLQKSRKLAGQKDLVFVAGLEKDLFAKYVFVGEKIPYYHPTTKEYLGSEMRIIGKGKLVKREELSLLKIESATQEIKPGTIVMPSRSLNLSEKIQAVVFPKKTPGYVLSVIPGLGRGAASNVVVLNIGARDGAKVGQLLKIKDANLVLNDPYRVDKKYDITLDDPKGEIVIYDVFNKLSLGLVLTSTADIKILDQVE
jgi:hypothetical protein